MLSDRELTTLVAAADRILPGAADLGAAEFFRRFLSGQAVYSNADGSGFRALRGRAAAAWDERLHATRQQLRDGIARLDELAAGDFAHAPAEDQDDALRRLEAEATVVDGGRPPANQPVSTDDLSIFAALCLWVRQAYYCDPVYGGNADRRGWATIGYPGPERMADVAAGLYTTRPYLAADEPGGP